MAGSESQSPWSQVTWWIWDDCNTRYAACLAT